MPRPSLLAAALFAFTAATSHAQAFDLHTTFAFAHVGTSTTTFTDVPGITNTYAPANSSYNAVGVTIGGTGNFIDGKRQQLGIDLRETIAPSATSGAFLSLGGLRYSVFARHSRFRPYVEIAGGAVIERQRVTETDVITTGFTTKTVHTDNDSSLHGVFEGLIGVDTKVSDLLSIRTEFGGGHAGASTIDGPGSGSLVTVNAGVVFHFD